MQIDDFRLKTPRPFHPNPRIGYVTTLQDLGDFSRLITAMKTWLGAKDVAEVARAVLAYFEAEKFQWGRLFRVRGKGDSRELYSFDEFGLSNTDIMLRKDFINDHKHQHSNAGSARTRIRAGQACPHTSVCEF